MPPSTRSTVPASGEQRSSRRASPRAGRGSGRATNSSAARATSARGRAPRDAENRPAGVRVPVRRAEPGQRRHEMNAVVRRGGACGAPGQFGGVADDARAVAKPLHRSAREEDRALERVGPLAVDLLRDGGEEPVLATSPAGRRCSGARSAGAVGRFQHARPRSRPGRTAPLAGRRRCPDGIRRAEDGRFGVRRRPRCAT